MKYMPVVVAGNILLFGGLSLISSGMYIHQNIREHPARCISALFQLIAEFSVIYMWIVAFHTRAKLINIFKRFQGIYNNCNFILPQMLALHS